MLTLSPPVRWGIHRPVMAGERSVMVEFYGLLKKTNTIHETARNGRLSSSYFV